MILDKDDLKDYIAKDKYALGIDRSHPRILGDDIWKFQIYLRKHEYYNNTNKNKIALLYYKYKHYNMGVKLGFSIPCNVFGPGLRINHYGLIIVNPKAKIGAFCDIHQGVNIGEGIDGIAPVIGNNVWIGPGAKLYGNIKIGDEIMIGTNSVVNKSFEEKRLRIAGAPARIISKEGNIYIREYRKVK